MVSSQLHEDTASSTTDLFAEYTTQGGHNGERTMTKSHKMANKTQTISSLNQKKDTTTPLK